ncbi:DUF4387 domain-containing protein [Variovorax sp. J22R133]|uniref:DUF4387 domain-containing protein n=1 Tax=Variovorax brevis TaxID=3053503 RepID=UPI0025753195|nr:DUF4387 domain-containing protein [Variovorax sp. J22R133]MDM0115424.1 DUF4387 domain-containing protein [Variovorax sp. J22R133]
MSATTLGQLASVLRSKNAGPFQITIDLMFGDAAAYARVLGSGVLNAATVARLYQVDAAQVSIIPFERVFSIEVTVARTSGTRGSGSAFDRDVYGAQQHGPLAALELS